MTDTNMSEPSSNVDVAEVLGLAQNDPTEFLRIFARGQQADITPIATPPPPSTNSQMDQLIATLQAFVANTTSIAPQPSIRKETIRVTLYDGNPDTLHRFLAELDSKIALEKWTQERDRIILAESLLAKGEKADRLMNAYRHLGQTTVSTLEEWKACLTALCEDTGAQEKANRAFNQLYFDKSKYQSYAEFFAEFCTLANKTSKTDNEKYDQLVLGTPGWLRRLARPIPEAAQLPNWRMLAAFFNRIYVEDDQIKTDDSYWKSKSSPDLKQPNNKPLRKSAPQPPATVPSVTIPVPTITPTPTPDPMDIDSIQTAQQATALVRGRKLNDWIRLVCNKFHLCLLCREPGHSIATCPITAKISTIQAPPAAAITTKDVTSSSDPSGKE